MVAGWLLVGCYFNPRFPRGKRPASTWASSFPFWGNFNPRFPRGKRRYSRFSSARLEKFQSTLPAGEATRGTFRWSSSAKHFNPRFPRGKRLKLFPVFPKQAIRFQSTLPAGEATAASALAAKSYGISIHASRGGSDSTVKLSPDDRTSRHGFREPGFLRFRHRQISCLFLLGAWGSRL